MRTSTCNLRRASRSAGLTLIEVVMSVAIISIMLSSVHTLNSQCVSVMRSKRNMGASSHMLQERVERFRMASWASVTTSAGVTALMAGETNSSLFGFMGTTDLVEKVSIVAINPATGNAIGLPLVASRVNNVLTVSGNTNLTTAMAVRLDFECSWKEMGRNVGPRKLSTTLGSFGFTRTAISRKPYLPKAPNS